MIINQGDIWKVEFEPSVGGEIQKSRPAIVVNDDRVGRFGIKIVIPITEWKNYYNDFPWILKIEPTAQNGLSKTSSIECFQVKSFAEERFIEKMGFIDNDLLFQVHTTIVKILNPQYKI